MTIDIHIKQSDDWTDASAIDIQRNGDVLQVWFVMADGRQIPLANTTLANRTRTKLPFVAGMVRVKELPGK